MEDNKILMIVASREFRDQEFFDPKEVFENEGIEVVVANSSGFESEGSAGAKVAPNMKIEQVTVDDYDAIVFVGGAGSREYQNDDTALQIIKDAVALGKIVAAICIAPVILASAGILKGKKVAVSESGIEFIKSHDAIYTGKEVEVDGNIITASGPNASESFAKTIVESLKKQ